MIIRIDRLQTAMPPPSDPDPVGASAVQELLGGKFGEMSTFMNYTYQSFNFRNRQGARPFYDLLASIAAEEFGHIELVSTAINTMLTPAADGAPGEAGSLEDVKGTRNTQQFLAGGAATLVQDSMGKPWSGDYVNATGDLIGDLTHNFFLETGARNNKLKVYEMVDHPAARALTGYLLVRGGVHQVAYARALENLTGADMMKLFPSPRIPTDKIPECQPHIQRGEHLKLYRFSPSDFQEIAAVFNGPHPETGEELHVAEEIHPEGAPAFDLPAQPAVFAPGPEPQEIEEIAAKLREAAGLSKEPTGVVAQDGDGSSNGHANGGGVMEKVKDAIN
jgi:Mn-containing catalase